MVTIVTRAGKGSPLTNTEMDTNLTNLNSVTPAGGAVAAASGVNSDITNLSGAIINTKRAIVASSATTSDIWAAAGNEIDWTGTTTCTGFPAAPQAGASRMLICAGAAPFTAGANMLIAGVASGNTITLSANDTVEVHAITTAQFLLLITKYDGTPVSSTSYTPPVRQTVLSGPVDSSGYADFGGSTGSTTVTASGTLKATAAAGGDANHTGSIVNPSWTGISSNGTMYLYLDITSAGGVTTGSTTLGPVYQWGGTYSTTNGQNTYNIQEATMKVGNGSGAAQVYRVFVGKVTVAGNVTTAITWYALMGRYDSGFVSTLPGTATNVVKSSNIGAVPLSVALTTKCLSAENGYAVGDVVAPYTQGQAGFVNPFTPYATDNTVGFTTGAVDAWQVMHKTTGALTVSTGANWAYRLTAQRGW